MTTTQGPPHCDHYTVTYQKVSITQWISIKSTQEEQTRRHPHTQTHTQTHTDTQTHRHTHTQTHTHTDTHTHTHTHTHTFCGSVEGGRDS